MDIEDSRFRLTVILNIVIPGSAPESRDKHITEQAQGYSCDDQ